jgi:murein L,D-transpeptidase YcbB/YkuD
LVGGVKTFQVRHGLPDDGVIGVDTQDELAATAEDRARQIATNMERRRWLARVVPTERIDVNTAASILVYWRNGAPIHGSRVVNGKASSPTPSLEAPFSTIMANPPWNVPAGIAAKEILPKGPGYLASHNMYMVDGRVVQRAGPSSALGAVKFEMQNPYAIYLHDTPSKGSFSRYQRHLSHGCVRVENAVDFARLVMDENPDAVSAFDTAQADNDSTRVKVGKSIPVRLLYWTAFMTGADRVAFRKDVYGWDSKLGEALGVGALSFQAADRTKSDDVGP